MNLPFKNKPVKRTLLILLLIILLISITLFIFSIYSTGLNGNGVIDFKPSIYLLSDGFHSGVLIPNYNNLFSRIYSKAYWEYAFVHYTFAEKSWYLDMNRTFLDIFPTLFIETEGVIERTFIPDSFSITEAKPYFNYAFDIDVWSFRTTEENLVNTIMHIEENEIASGDRFESYVSRLGFIFDFFPTYQKYTLFYNCHHFNLDMLRLNELDSRGEWYVFLDFLLRAYLQKLLEE